MPSDIDEHGLHHARERLINWSAGPVYLSIDLDCLDLFAAPGVSTPYPFGLSSRELLFLAKSVLDKQVCMLDIVELSPSKDLNERTARTAAILLHELSSSLQALH